MKRYHLVLAISVLIIACQKKGSDPRYTCTCTFRHWPNRDTTVKYPMAAGSSKTQAQTECTNKQAALTASYGTGSSNCQLQ